MSNEEKSVGDKTDGEEGVPLEDVLDLVGTGRYTSALIVTSGIMLLAMALELFGFSFVVTASTCDLDLNLQEQGILSSLSFTAVIFSSYMWGFLADTRGRRRVLLWSMYVSFALSTLSSLSPNWIAMAVIKFFSVSFSCATNAATYTLLGECCPAAVRSRNMLVASIPFMFTPGLTALISYAVLSLNFAYDMPWLGITFRPWRLLIIVLALPCGISALSMHFYNESPKFLASCGKMSEALDVLRRMYVINKGVNGEEFKVKSVVLEEGSRTYNENQSLIRSMWELTTPLFRPPLLKNTLKLYFILFSVYITNTSFVMWFPRLLGLLFQAWETNDDVSSSSICSLLSSSIATTVNGSVEVTEVCNEEISVYTVYAILALSTCTAGLAVVISQLHNRKKAITMASVFASCVSSVCVSVIPEPISGMVFFLVFVSTGICTGVLSSYFVELYPTAYRGTVASLGLVIGRLSGFVGINLVGSVIFSHCNITFYAWTILLFCTVVVVYYLPPDQVKKPSDYEVKTDVPNKIRQ